MRRYFPPILACLLCGAPLAAQDFTCAFDTLCPAEGACETVEVPVVLDIDVDREARSFAVGEETFTEVTLPGLPTDGIAFGREGDDSHAGVFRFVDIAGTVILLNNEDALGLGYAGLQGNCAIRKDG